MNMNVFDLDMIDGTMQSDGPRCDAFDAGAESSDSDNYGVSFSSRWYRTKWGDARSGAIPHQLDWVKGRTGYQSSLIQFDLVRARMGRK